MVTNPQSSVNTLNIQNIIVKHLIDNYMKVRKCIPFQIPKFSDKFSVGIIIQKGVRVKLWASICGFITG